MRRTTVLVLTACLASGGGCHFLEPYWNPRPETFETTPRLEQVLENVNQNSAKVQSLAASRTSISSSMSPVSASADIYLARPRNFRLQAGTALTGTQFDLGSNDREVWAWLGGMATGDVPTLLYCSQEQFPASDLRRIVPVDTAWLVDAFGLPTFSPADRHTGPVPNGKGRLEIRSLQETAGGAFTRLTIVDERYGDVLEQHVYDARGQLLASALTSDHDQDAATGAWLPRNIEVRFPTLQSTLQLQVDRWQVNTLGPEQAGVFERPIYPGTRAVDVGTAPMRRPQAYQPPPSGRSALPSRR
jgi:outer membrane lipoprotein-sorting protein